mmetsp:Transcript_31506/g.94672  ORF Transcript_31506/g.94672 Transcript_31506/m.94672 type:complete len:207 (+) Transcript_31506:5193-5813(+)
MEVTWAWWPSKRNVLVPKPTALLQSLGKLFVKVSVAVRDRFTGMLPRLVEVLACETRDGVLGFCFFVHLFACLCHFALTLNVFLYAFPNSNLHRTLAQLGQVRARKALCDTGDRRKVDIVRHWRLAQVCLQDGNARVHVRKWNVKQLVQTARTHDCPVEHIWAIRRTNDKHVLLTAHTIHFCQQLVDHAIGSAATVARVAPALDSD